MPGDGRPSVGLPDALGSLRRALLATPFGLELDGAGRWRTERDALVRQINDYLLPRLASLDAPLLAVVGGSTGAGKSTLVNSLVGEDVTTAGVLRPTTRAPVLVCAPADRHWFADERVLPAMPRTTGAPGGAGTLQLVTSSNLPPGLALLDAPDVDSVVAENRALAVQLLAAADLWVFVTTASRYADAVPWELLRQARQRSAAIGVILDRVPAEAAAVVPGALAGMLAEQGLGEAEVFSIAESVLHDGRLPTGEVAPVLHWLHGLAADADSRSQIIRQTLSGALSDVDRRTTGLVTADEEQAGAAATLSDLATTAYVAARGSVEEGVRSGSILRGEVLARWQEFVGTGELLRSVQSTVSRLRDRLVSAVSGRPTADADVRGAVETEVESLIRAAADTAADSTVAAWRRHPAGTHLLAGQERELATSSAQLDERLPTEVRAWQGTVLDLVRAQGADKRTEARVASYTVNGAGLAVMLAVFAQTGGLTGIEIAVAGGTSAASQKVLEAIFGDQAVRTLARDARRELLTRVDDLLRSEEQRFLTRVEKAQPTASVPLLAALRRWQSAVAAGPMRAT